MMPPCLSVPLYAACAIHTTSFVEIQAPMFSRRAWTSFHNTILSKIPNKILYKTPWIDALWCSFVEKKLDSHCVYSKLTTVKHLNLKTMNKTHKQHVMNYNSLPKRVQQYIRWPSRTERVTKCFDEYVFR